MGVIEERERERVKEQLLVSAVYPAGIDEHNRRRAAVWWLILSRVTAFYIHIHHHNIMKKKKKRRVVSNNIFLKGRKRRRGSVSSYVSVGWALPYLKDMRGLAPCCALFSHIRTQHSSCCWPFSEPPWLAESFCVRYLFCSCVCVAGARLFFFDFPFTLCVRLLILFIDSRSSI